MTLHRLLAAAALAALSAPALAGPAPLGDDVNAKLARIKGQQAAAAAGLRSAGNPGGAAVTAVGGNAAGGAGGPGALGNGCNIAIGNVFTDNARGVSTNARRETTVIITGDVIQVGNQCR